MDWAILLKDNPDAGMVARIGYNYWLRSEYRASFGYDVAVAYWRRGIATEAARAVAAFGFDQMGLRRIEADTYRENLASQRVLEKVGFRKVGVERDWDYGSLRELFLYALTHSEWTKQRV
ncbi:MAG: GNAT family N-acetyltransferase [Chloroflexi bacterium]|nr:GNAT family N-acetyltransferase [Chloroflexota bacterium]